MYDKKGKPAPKKSGYSKTKPKMKDKKKDGKKKKR